MAKYYRTRTQEEYDWLMRHLEETTDVRWQSGQYPTECQPSRINGVIMDNGRLSISGMFSVEKEIEVSDLMKEERLNPFKELEKSIRSLENTLSDTVSHEEMMKELGLDNLPKVNVTTIGALEGTTVDHLYEANEYWYNEDSGCFEISNDNNTLIATFPREIVYKIELLEEE